MSNPGLIKIVLKFSKDFVNTVFVSLLCVTSCYFMTSCLSMVEAQGVEVTGNTISNGSEREIDRILRQAGSADQVSWTPAILITEPGLTVRENDLLFSPLSPAVGSCSIVNSLRTGDGDVSRSFRIANPGSAAEGSVAVITDREQREVWAVGVFDSLGGFSCPTPAEGGVIRAGHGMNQVATAFGSENADVVVSPSGLGFLGISADDRSGILPGSLLRIGRLASGIETNLPAQTSPFQDLFFRLLSSSESFFASEGLRTTILVERPFRLQLQIGLYRVVVIPPSGPICQVIVEIAEGDAVSLVCSSSAENKVDSADSRVVMDATLFSQQFVQSPTFLAFLRHREALVLGRATQQRGTRETISFVGATDAASITGLVLQRSPNASLTTWDDTIQRVFSVDQAFNAQRLCHRIAEHGKRDKLIFAGTGESGLMQGTPPFLFSTWIERPSGIDDLMETQLLMTNGARISWLGHETKRNLVALPSQQRYRFSIEIPAGNDTRYAALYVGATETKRYTIPRGSLETHISYVVDEKIPVERDFRVTLCAWGDDFLPDLIYGPQHITPFSAIRSLCVDADANGFCQAED